MLAHGEFKVKVLVQQQTEILFIPTMSQALQPTQHQTTYRFN
jgi:hypothetical protein